MLSKTIIKNCIGLIDKYYPNLFVFISEREFTKFLHKAHKHTKSDFVAKKNNNFIYMFFKLLEEYKFNNANIARNQFEYFNYLFGKFQKYGNKKEFKNLLLGVLYNFKSNNFHHTLGEIAVCLDLCLKYSFKKYERILQNESSIDFEFTDKNGEIILVDAYTIDYNKERYEKEKFKAFLDNRLKVKFQEKTKDLDLDTKRKVFVFPILNGFTVDIVKEQSEYLKKVSESTIEMNGFQTFAPRAFGNVQGTFFCLFTIDEIVNPEKIKKNYSQHGV